MGNSDDFSVHSSLIFSGISRLRYTLYGELRTWVGREARAQHLRAEEVSFTQRQVRELTGLGHTWIKQSLRQLVEYDYVSIARGGSERSRAYYRLREDAEIGAVDLSMIPSPEAMAERLSGSTA